MKTRSGSVSEILKFLGSMRSFSNLSESSLLLLARSSRFEYFAKGEILFFQGDPSEIGIFSSEWNYLHCTEQS